MFLISHEVSSPRANKTGGVMPHVRIKMTSTIRGEEASARGGIIARNQRGKGYSSGGGGSA